MFVSLWLTFVVIWENNYSCCQESFRIDRLWWFMDHAIKFAWLQHRAMGHWVRFAISWCYLYLSLSLSFGAKGGIGSGETLCHDIYPARPITTVSLADNTYCMMDDHSSSAPRTMGPRVQFSGACEHSH